MELKFEELDVDTQATESNYTNYWSNANPVTTNPKKPKVSYDDILSSLNMVVNNGVLQFAKPIQKPEKQEKQEKQEKKPQKKTVTIRAPPKQQQQQQQVPQNDYITNKYFKDYKDRNVVEEPQVPLTKEEYRQMLIQDYINRQQAQKRISQIKSRKLLFDTKHINIAPNQMPRDMNKLFKPFSR